MNKIGLVAFVVLFSACGLVSGAPRLHYDPPVLYSHSLLSPAAGAETAENQWIVPAAKFVGGTIGSAIGSRVLNNVVDCRVCGKCNAELQQDTDKNNIERSAKIMALVQLMDEIGAAKESLNALKKISVQDAEIQFNEAVSVKINSIGETLGNAGNYLKGAAKNLLCH
jgi:hypothetical protein